ncbi:hypothetical protein L2E82_17295 [Cichorium intybus]|uniref:Uncharacterized protein n=1 Tax=Cichorium intybus TaxID=13427 RepID=A0ACB9F7W2_CICIN|nr:hypothetical protein L2E82_17295 [Cichorium intybus]
MDAKIVGSFWVSIWIPRPSRGKEASSFPSRSVFSLMKIDSTLLYSVSLCKSLWKIMIQCLKTLKMKLNLWEGLPLFGVKIVFKVGPALLKYCHDDLVSKCLEELKQEYEKIHGKVAESKAKQKQPQLA